MIVDEDEAARVDEALDAHQWLDAAKSRQHHRIAERQLVRRLNLAILGDLLGDHLARFDLLDARAGQPLDVAFPHLALEQAFRVADAVEAEMADVGL